MRRLSFLLLIFTAFSALAQNAPAPNGAAGTMNPDGTTKARFAVQLLRPDGTKQSLEHGWVRELSTSGQQIYEPATRQEIANPVIRKPSKYAAGIVMVDGDRAKVRFRAGEAIQFLAWLPDTKPQDMRLYISEARMGNRAFYETPAQFKENGKTKKAGTIELTFSTVQPSWFRFESRIPLPPGEYGFADANSSVVFLFGVDK
jgi:hypothetical protein